MTAMKAHQDTLTAHAIRVRGLVQGVGFRPTVWRIAQDCGLVGAVLNDGDGVLIRAKGTPGQFTTFLQRLQAEAPPLSRIDEITTTPLNDETSFGAGFQIVESQGGLIRTGIVPDAATCPTCLNEILDRENRRHRYAFTNCTHCGPRLSIIRSIPL